MDDGGFDRLVRAVAMRGSRRRVLGGLLAGALGSLRVRPTAADDSGTAIADASGGNHNATTVTDPATGGNDHDRDNREQCQPKSQGKLCEGRCDLTVDDGCGGTLKCTCDGKTECAPRDGVCCRPERLCAGMKECCQGSDTCAPEDVCCPPERLCLPSNRCCPGGEVCAPGGGVCCAPQQVCTVGGVADACCAGVCTGGVCV